MLNPNLHRGQRFQVVPTNEDTDVWGGQPLAFLRGDFTFYDSSDCIISHSDLYKRHQQKQIAIVHIRFRYDKSAENFSFRKFPLSTDAILNPVDAAISILHRADLLGVPVNEPVGVYGGQSGYYFLRDSHIRDILHLICIHTYPDSNHYLRLHILRLVPHSNHVPAALPRYPTLLFGCAGTLLVFPPTCENVFKRWDKSWNRPSQGPLKHPN